MTLGLVAGPRIWVRLPSSEPPAVRYPCIVTSHATPGRPVELRNVVRYVVFWCADAQKRTATIVADEDGTLLATLSRGAYLQAMGGYTDQVINVLSKPPADRTGADLDLVLQSLKTEPFIAELYFFPFQRRVIRQVGLSPRSPLTNRLCAAANTIHVR